MRPHELIKNFWNDDRGQTTTEYILILAVVVMIAVKFKTLIGSKLETLTNSVGGKMDGFVNE